MLQYWIVTERRTDISTANTELMNSIMRVKTVWYFVAARPQQCWQTQTFSYYNEPNSATKHWFFI